MKRTEQDQLLESILSGPDLVEFRQTTLEHGLMQLRTQRLRRRVLRLAFACLAAGLVIPVFLGIRSTENRRERVEEKSTAMAAPSSAVQSQVQFITDEQLFALFPNRHMALIGKPGEQQLVFLDQPARYWPAALLR
jgi:hypothetical protein